MPAAEERAGGVAVGRPSGDASLGSLMRMYPLVSVAIIGFIGVIGAQFANAWLTRRRDDRERQQKAKSLAAAISVECNTFANACQRMFDTSPTLDTLEKKYTVARATLFLPRHTVTETNLRDISLLGHKIAACILELYAHRSRWDRILQIATEPERSDTWLTENYDGIIEALPELIHSSGALRNALVAFDQSREDALAVLNAADAARQRETQVVSPPTRPLTSDA